MKRNRKENCRGRKAVRGSFVSYQMKYQHIVEGIFLSRPNRFIAKVEIGGKEETVHVKNTGRCRELLLPGARVYLEYSPKPGRKTSYDLIGVYKEGLGLVNMDSQAPNAVVREWLVKQQAGAAVEETAIFRQIGKIKPEFTYGQSRIDFFFEADGKFRQIGKIKPEFTYGQSRIDFFFEADGKNCLMEVKGVTLERERIAYFPDAPTQRGVKHIQELEMALEKGYDCYVAFVIQMPGICEICPNDETHPAFGEALRAANRAGVRVLALGCEIGEDSLDICQVREMRY